MKDDQVNNEGNAGSTPNENGVIQDQNSVSRENEKCNYKCGENIIFTFNASAKMTHVNMTRASVLRGETNPPERNNRHPSSFALPTRIKFAVHVPSVEH